MHVCLRCLGSFPGLCPPECRCQRVTLPQPSIDPGATMALGTGRGVGWPLAKSLGSGSLPSCRPQEEMSSRQPGWLRCSGVPSPHPAHPPQGPGGAPSRSWSSPWTDVATLHSLGRKGRRAGGAGGLQVVHGEAAACCDCPPALPSCCSLSCTPNLGRPWPPASLGAHLPKGTP